MPIEWGKVREYAMATGNVRPEYLDDPRAPIPPTFLSTVIFWDDIGHVYEQPEAATAFAAAGVERGWDRLLSLEQEYVFAGTVPRAGDVLEISHRFDGIETKSGKRGGTMMLVRFTVEFLGVDGCVRAECRYTSAYLSEDPRPATRAPQASPVAAAAEPAPSDIPPRSFGPVTMTDIVRYQGASGDMNPMHHDDDFARSAGYPAAFSVGTLGAGYLATVCTDAYGVNTVRRFRTRFRDLVWRGETLTAAATRRGEVRIDGEHRVCLDLRLTSDNGKTAIEGSAEFAV